MRVDLWQVYVNCKQGQHESKVFDFKHQPQINIHAKNGAKTQAIFIQPKNL